MLVKTVGSNKTPKWAKLNYNQKLKNRFWKLKKYHSKQQDWKKKLISQVVKQTYKEIENIKKRDMIVWDIHWLRWIPKYAIRGQNNRIEELEKRRQEYKSRAWCAADQYFIHWITSTGRAASHGINVLVAYNLETYIIW